MIYLVSILLTIVIIILILTIGFDLFLYYKSVFFRIKIGRWTNQNHWLKSITAVNLKWLKNTPTVKLTDSERYVILDIYKGKYRKKSIQSWQEAGVLLGAISTLNQTSETTSQIQAFIDDKVDTSKGTWRQVPEYVDGVILAYALAKQTEDLNNLKPLFDETITLIEKNKGDDGTVFYRDFIPDIRFVDTIGFICPFLTFYGVNYNKPEYIDLAFNQIEQYINKAFLKNQMIPAHAFDIKQNAPLGIYGWGRGLGWFILGIVDMYNELPESHLKKKYLKELIIKTSQDTLPFQNDNGSFSAMLFLKDYRHDSSITTLAGWLFFNTYLITKKTKYKNAANKCITSLMHTTRRNGVVDFCQGDTKGMGDYAKTFDLMPFVQGLTIRLSIGLSKL